MPQLDFFLNEQERLALINFSFSKGFTIVPDLKYTGETYKIANSLEDYYKYCNDSPLLFLMHADYSTLSLKMDFFIDEKGDKIFFIKQKYCGPTIDFYSPIIGERKEKTLGPGFIGIYPMYFSDNGNFLPTSQLKEMFKLLTWYIKNSAIAVELTKRTFWIGKKTKDDAEAGNIKLLNVSGVDILKIL